MILFIFLSWCDQIIRHFREFGSENIPKVYSFDASVFEQEELNILDLVWSVYGKYDAKYLERLTHYEKPWVNASVDKNED
ncbi:Panacea domain-containing protein [Desulfosporosinus fructosivorans]|uniref:Panacea domain-containing protein n=1 Tax=Desulfosporosinus fructosivorans TaxID=2018669 RepID=UPI001A7E965E|nr:type II toxin-antitoxin system antitoxin SocA domain-containing protein [Desulfosporosinus fructosivorans]